MSQDVFGKNYKAKPVWLSIAETLSDPVVPARFPEQKLRYRNEGWAERLGLNPISEAEWLMHFSQFQPLPQNIPHPLALRYHGHQFTHYNPDLGDGRGFLFAQMEDPIDHRLLDFGTKGSGQTPYSRRGDGRLTLKGGVREVLATTYLESKGVNTSKSFSLVETGESLERHDEPSPTRSSVLVRLSHSHVRIGTFQRLAFIKDSQTMKQLVDYCLVHLFPNISYADFFPEICKRVAHTTAQWMIHGFVHGVLNTDNINITGESFDYGPYRFLPHYDLKFTAAYFDHQGLYAYGQQPTMVFWNLERLKEALQLIDYPEESFQNGLALFKRELHQKTLDLFCQKIGIGKNNDPNDIKNLFYQCLQFLEKSKAPFEAFFHHLYLWHQNLDKPLQNYDPHFYQSSDLEEIEIQLGRMEREASALEKEDQDLQTLLIDEIESIWTSIDQQDDWTPFQNKISTLLSLPK